MNSFQLFGHVVDVSLWPVKPGSDEQTGRLTLLYGPRRNFNPDRQSQYVNIAEIKIPTKTAQMVEHRRPGDLVAVLGRVQGVWAPGGLTMELIASSCKLWDALEGDEQDCFAHSPDVLEIGFV
ncbi:hypothetical protein [Sinimarinibacterium sp. NLF-5-8]|uniref:hypothetical protein n=1 Tax=Sinimarinibacterium sp. NLF-5-8 TaxID=2698684 RepID=UPI00137BC259|nr:hypothetical protein [Sinimarinibacterium sp. NLF-5-8]QHS09117.1 hypothetical protein GT972_02415 [Sinimarinibacterium sp. NLF-5-8]